MGYLGVGSVIWSVTTVVAVSTSDMYRAYLARKAIKNIEKEMTKLILNRDPVKEIFKAIRIIEKVNDAVIEWLRDTDILLQELRSETVKVRMAKLGSVYEHDVSMTYCHEMLNKLQALNKSCKFEPFSSPIPNLEYFSSGNFVCFASVKEASDRLLEALNHDDFYKIGLYGKRGSGKTKLVKAVAEKVKHLRIFDVVLFFTLTQNSNVRQIQDEIAESLNLNFDINTMPERAKKIYSTLESMDRQVLVILDDVQGIDLGDVGIPYHSNRCKILLTARSQPKCASMNCQREIPLNPLTTEEAWTLFKKHSDIDYFSSSDLLDVACKVAIECEGLPGKIEDVGSSLRGKSIKTWNITYDNMTNSSTLYDIFLSFRGKDTRDSFTISLFHALRREGFKVFMDDEGLNGGDEISSSLIKAIERSRISIVIFSENFAYSSWCLDELVTILDCKKTKSRHILPIFYKIEPSDVRHQRGSYEKAMAEHEKKYGEDSEKVKKWRSVLSEVANVTGIHHKSGYDYIQIQNIVEMVNGNFKSWCIQTDTD